MEHVENILFERTFLDDFTFLSRGRGKHWIPLEYPSLYIIYNF
jgi:hypothetical protein